WLGEICGLVVAKLSGNKRIHPEHAMVAGVLHDLGCLPILTYADVYPEVVARPDLLERIMCELRPHVSGQLLRTWSFSGELIRVAMESEEWTRDPGMDPDYCDVVLVAQHQRMRESDPDIPPPEEVSAYERLGVSPEFIITEAAQIESARQMLMG
ncbi:MAG: HDOD domain-containing protein, partial [Chromatiales bacterium]|nr:HDOD domain-containing protein [Chromatiales bacterium]